MQNYGIVGEKAPEFGVKEWVDGQGAMIKPIELKDLAGKKVVIFGFQSWCPGCHSGGFPTLGELIELYQDRDDVVFLAVQTVFEGFDVNTYERMREDQKHYDLGIPFGHDVGDVSTHNRSSIMHGYRSGGTPWFIVLDEDHRVVYNDFRITVEQAQALLG